MEGADKRSAGPQSPAYHTKLPAAKHLAYLQAQHCCVAGSAHKGESWAERLWAGLHLCLRPWGWLWRPTLAAGGLRGDGHMPSLSSRLRARRGLQAVQNSNSAQRPSCPGPCKPCWEVVMLQAKTVTLDPPEMVMHSPGQQWGECVQQVSLQSGPCCSGMRTSSRPVKGSHHGACLRGQPWPVQQAQAHCRGGVGAS